MININFKIPYQTCFELTLQSTIATVICYSYMLNLYKEG